MSLATSNIAVAISPRVMDYGGSILVSNRWDTNIGEIGLLVDVAHSRLTSRANFFRAEPYYPQAACG